MERRAAGQDMQFKGGRYWSLSGQFFDAVAILKNGKTLFLNERAAEILGGKTFTGLTGRPIFDLIHVGSRRDVEVRISQAIAEPSKPGAVVQEKFLRIDGTTVLVDLMLIGITYNGEPALQIMFREVTGSGYG